MDPISPLQDIPVPTPKSPLEYDPAQDPKKQEVLSPKQAAGWATQEELLEIKSNIEAAIEYQKSNDRWEKWHEYLDYLNCRWDAIYDDFENDHCNVNTIFSNFQTEIPTLYFQQPEVNVTAKKPTFKKMVMGQAGQQIPVAMDNFQAAKLFGKRLNNVIANVDIEPIVERVIGDALAPYGYGVFKVGLGLSTEANHDLEQEITLTTYWVRRVDPRNIYFDPLAPSFRERGFTAEKLSRSKKKLKGNPLYDAKAVDLLNTKVPETLKARLDKIGNKYNPDLVEFFEYHDEEKAVVRWVSIDGVPREIRKPLKKKTWIEGSDYTILALNVETDDSIYPLSDVDPVIDQAISRNRIRSAQMRYFENVGITAFVEAGAFPSEEDENQWLKSGNGFTMVKLKNGAISGNKFQVASPPRMPPDWITLDETHRRDNDETLGITDYQRGQPDKRTATEGSLVANAATVRISRRRRKIKNAILEVVKKIAALVVQYDDEKNLINIADLKEDDGFMKYVKDTYQIQTDIPYLEVSKEDYQGEYLFDFDLEEMVERPKSVQIQQLVNSVAQVAGSQVLAQAFVQKYDPDKIIEKVFELQGIHLESVYKDKQGSLSPEIENEMAERGLEIPPPHPKDEPHHMFVHTRLEKEMRSKLPSLMKGAATGDPEAVEAYYQVKRSLEIIQRHILLTQNAEMQNNKLNQLIGMSVTSPANGPSMAPNGASIPAQMTGQGQPAAPTEMGVNQNAGANLGF